MIDEDSCIDQAEDGCYALIVAHQSGTLVDVGGQLSAYISIHHSGITKGATCEYNGWGRS